MPLSITQKEQIKSIRDWADVRAVSATPTEHLSRYGRRSKEKKPEAGDILTTRGGRTLDF